MLAIKFEQKVMKKTILITLIFLGGKLFAQPAFQNGSFENWYSVGSHLYPNSWDCDSVDINAQRVKRVTGGTAGTYAVQIGSYLDQGFITGASIWKDWDSVTSVPGKLMFDYKVVNNTSSLINGIYAEIYFYDKDKNPIDISVSEIDIPSRSSSFQTASYNLNFGGKVPKYYEFLIGYSNLEGNTSEYCVIDNIRFANNPNDVSDLKNNILCIFPNPSQNTIQFTDIEGISLQKIRLVAIDGKSFEKAIEGNLVDISAFANGIYTIEVYNSDNVIVSREKLSIIGH
jgi:hypothetical protein